MSAQWIAAFNIVDDPTMPTRMNAKRVMEQFWVHEKTQMLYQDCMIFSARVRQVSKETADAKHGEQIMRAVSAKLQQAYEALTSKHGNIMTSSNVMFDYNTPAEQVKDVKEVPKKDPKEGDAKPQKPPSGEMPNEIIAKLQEKNGEFVE